MNGLILPWLFAALLNLSTTSIEVGAPIEITSELPADQLAPQIKAPYELLSIKEEKGVTSITLTSWTPGLHPLSFSYREKDEKLFTPIVGITVTAPIDSGEIELDNYLQGLLALPNEELSQLSDENRKRIEQWGQDEKGASPLNFWKILIGSIATALILFASYWFFLRLRAREARAETRLDPKEEARRALEQLADKRLVEKGEVDHFYVELTAIIRRYIEAAFGLRAPEQTTEEFLAELQRSSFFPHTSQELLSRFLRGADSVKFAKHAPAVEDSKAALEVAFQFVSTSSLGNGEDGSHSHENRNRDRTNCPLPTA